MRMDHALEEAASPAGLATEYTRNNPYLSTVQENYLLTLEGSEKQTRHIELSLAEGMSYTPGDALGIVPQYRPQLVRDTLAALRFTGEERVVDHNQAEISLEEALRTRLSIGKLARGCVGQYAKLAPDLQGLKDLVGPENKTRLEEYCWGRAFFDLVNDYPGVITDPQQLFNILPRLTPRLYSIASSQKAHPASVQLTVRVIEYNAHGRERQGVASGELGYRAGTGTRLPIFVNVNPHFRLPEDSSAPVIMVGPGTGVAPFRAFLEERQASGCSGDNWLFFGDQHEKFDFLYRDQFLGMVKDGTLTHLSTAFSRDQPQKIYVQDRIRENETELFAWLERGAYFYVCGDAARMAKDVEAALLTAIAKGMNGTPEKAVEYLAAMKKQKRYQRDIY